MIYQQRFISTTREILADAWVLQQFLGDGHLDFGERTDVNKRWAMCPMPTQEKNLRRSAMVPWHSTRERDDVSGRHQWTHCYCSPWSTTCWCQHHPSEMMHSSVQRQGLACVMQHHPRASRRRCAPLLPALSWAPRPPGFLRNLAILSSMLPPQRNPDSPTGKICPKKNWDVFPRRLPDLWREPHGQWWGPSVSVRTLTVEAAVLAVLCS